MYGSGDESKIVRGRKVLANGAVAGYVMVDGKEKWRIVTGASKDYLAGVRRKAGSPHKALSPKAAQMAFNRRYGPKGLSHYASPRGQKQARTYDLNHTKNVIGDIRYRRSPHRWDYQGVDTGSKVRAARSDAQKANDAKLKASPVRRARKVKQDGGYFW